MIYTHRCDTCKLEGYVQQAMSEEPEVTCPNCQTPTFLRRVLISPKVKIGQSLRNDGVDYREDLARFPNDPQAIVDGPRALRKLKDQRQREGWQFQNIDQAASAAPPKTDPNRSLAREAYEAARAKGFHPEE